jgi:hypothetical protein
MSNFFSFFPSRFGDVDNQCKVLSSIIGEVYKRVAGNRANKNIIQKLQLTPFDPRWLTQYGCKFDELVQDSKSFIEQAIDQLKKYRRYDEFHLYDGAEKEALRFLIKDENPATIYVPNAGFGDVMIHIKGIDVFESKTFHLENQHEFAHAIATVRAYIHGLRNVSCHLLPRGRYNTQRYPYILACIKPEEEKFLRKLFFENALNESRIVAIAQTQFPEKQTYHYEFLTQALVDIYPYSDSYKGFDWWVIDCISRTRGAFSFVYSLLNNLPDNELKTSLKQSLDAIEILPIGYYYQDRFNAYRKVLEDLCKYLHSYGVTDSLCTPNELTKLFQTIRELEDRISEGYEKNNNGSKYEYWIPPHVSLSLELCNRGSQEGSHVSTQCMRLYKEGQVPYLDHSVLYALLNVLQWALSLPTDPDEKIAYLEGFKEVIYINKEGQVEYDNDLGCYHIGYCCINYRRVGKRVRINTYTRNSNPDTKALYPIFTKDFTLLD